MKVKRWLSMFLCVLMYISVMPTMVYAAEQMTVRLNGQELISGQEVRCGEGTIEYDSTSNTLTLDNATISESSTQSVLIIQGQGEIANVTIKLLGNNKISSTSENQFPIAIVDANVTIQGTNAATLTLESNSDSLNSTCTDDDSYCNLTIDGCTVNITSHNWGGISTGGGSIFIKNNADVTVNSYKCAIWSANGTQIDNSSVYTTANGDGVNTLASNGDISVSNSKVEVNGTSSAAYPAIYAAGDINIDKSTVTSQSEGMRGIVTDRSMTVNDSTVTASGKTHEGIIVVDTFLINNSKITASSKPNDLIPAIVTYHLNITASDLTANGGMDLYDWYSGNATGSSFSITPASGKKAEFKVDDTNWNGSGAVHFSGGTGSSPYDKEVSFTEDEMKSLGAYRYVHIGEYVQGSSTIYYALHFNTNEGDKINSVVRESGTVIDLAEYVPVREGYTFSGWYEDEELTRPVTEVTLDNTKTIYAGWEEIQTDTRQQQEIFMTVPAQERDLKNGTRNTMSRVCTLKLGFAVDDPDLNLSYETSDPEVATVEDGKITYQGVGTCTVTVTAADTDMCKAASLEITVKVGSLGTPTFTPSVTSRTAKKAFTVTSSTVRGVDGWEVQYSIRNDFWRATTKDFPDTGAKLYRKVCTTVHSNMTYYIHVRGYQVVDGEKVYSDWSPVKTIRTK